MDEDVLTVRMEGRGGKDVRLEDFYGYLKGLRSALNATARALSGDKRSVVFFTIARLSHASPATVGLGIHSPQSHINLGNQAAHTVVESMFAVQHRQPPSSAFGRELLVDYLDLTEGMSGSLASVHLSYGKTEARISADTKRVIEDLLGKPYCETGTLRGHLEAVNVHSKPGSFWLYPTVGRRITCYFDDDLLADVRASLKKYVEVTGRLSFRPNAAAPYEVRASQVEPLPDNADLPSLRDLLGVAPDATGDLSPEDFIRKARDDWR